MLALFQLFQLWQQHVGARLVTFISCLVKPVLHAGSCRGWVIPGWRPLVQIPRQKGLLLAQVQHAVRPSALLVSHTHTSLRKRQFYTTSEEGGQEACCSVNVEEVAVVWYLLILSVLPAKKEASTLRPSSSLFLSWGWRTNRPLWLCMCQVRSSRALTSLQAGSAPAWDSSAVKKSIWTDVKLEASLWTFTQFRIKIRPSLNASESRLYSQSF